MNENTQKLHELIKKYAKMGIKRIKVGDIEIEFEPQNKKIRASKKNDEIKDEQLSEEELLFWSSQQG